MRYKSSASKTRTSAVGPPCSFCCAIHLKMHRLSRRGPLYGLSLGKHSVTPASRNWPSSSVQAYATP
eukprot:6407418-Amphidinium_carterae.2